MEQTYYQLGTCWLYANKINWVAWGLLLEGGLSQLWRAEQATFWMTIKTYRSSKRWVSELIKKLWAIFWDRSTY